MQLTSDQRHALDTIHKWIKHKIAPRISAARRGNKMVEVWENALSEGSIFTLAGHSGTGKSTAMRILADELGPQGRRGLVFTAPTNKATKVLRTMLAEQGIDDVPCYTIHSANGLTMADDKEEKYLVQSSDGVASQCRVVVVDEASMVGGKMFDMIREQLVGRGLKVLYVGDPCQLPPVKDGHAKAFLPDEIDGIVRLSEIVRQAEGHPVIELGEYFRKRIEGGKVSIPDGGGLVTYLPAVEFYRKMMATFVEHRDEPGEIRALAWRNRTVDGLAHKARAALHGDGAPDFIAGERIFTAKPFTRVRDRREIEHDPFAIEDTPDKIEIIMHTDQEAEIVTAEAPAPHPQYPTFEAIPVTIETDDGETHIGYSPYHAEIVDQERERLRQVAYAAMKTSNRKNVSQAWREFHAFNDAFVDFRSVHAMTAHRSQGSTFHSVFVDAQDMRQCGDKLRLLYVACTRARHNVYVRES